MNWHGPLGGATNGLWWQWAVQHQHRELGLLFLLLVAYIPIGVLTGIQILTTLKRHGDNPMAREIAYLMLAIATFGALGLFANIDPPSCLCLLGPSVNITYSTWFAWAYWIGSAILTVATYRMRRFALNPHNGSATHKQD